MDQLIIRTATLNDLQTLLEFEQGVVETERQFDSTLKAGTIHYYDLKGLIISPVAEVVVAEVENEIIASGYALIKKGDVFLQHSHYAHLGFMYVKPAYRGKGVNQKIVEALKQWATSKKITEIRLEVYAENIAAKKAYEKVGFSSHMLEMRMGLNEE
jgi:ribosomal protein S18 acetylase RimI-like enzyme